MIDVVMLAFNFNEELARLTESAIHSVKQSPMGRLLIIDNASEIRAGMLRDLADVYVRNKTNLGYPTAVNQGVSLARTEFIAIANNDIRVSPNWVNVSKSIFNEHPKVGSVHFRMIGYDHPIIEGSDIWITGKERWCHSSFYVIRKEAFQVYDENYSKGGFDDYDHHFRLRSKGWRQAYTNKVSFQHVDSITYRTMESKEDRSIRDLKNKEYYKTKFGEYPDIQFNKAFPEQITLPYIPFP